MSDSSTKTIVLELPSTKAPEPSMIPRFSSPFPGLSFAISDQIDKLREDWQIAAPQDNLFLQYRYLRILANHPPAGMHFRFIVFYSGRQPAGVALCQIIHFKAEHSLQPEDEDMNPCFFNTIATYLKGWVTSRVEFNSLVCGNLLLTGEHGFYFDHTQISPNLQAPLLDQALSEIVAKEENKKTRLSVILLKDYPEHPESIRRDLTGLDYNEFTVQPSMILAIPSHWHHMDDYIADLHSKYRVRLRRARKKCAGVTKKDLSAGEIRALLPEIHALYLQIATNAGFNLVSLNEHYLLAMKEQLGEWFQLTGYFHEGRLVAFYTTILNGEELEAHFLGLDHDSNTEKQLYLNILYDILERGIQAGVKRVVYARTAMEIKSSVGAQAHEMYCYLRHKSSFTNRFMTPLLEYLRPEANWVPRHPFKHASGMAGQLSPHQRQG